MKKNIIFILFLLSLSFNISAQNNTGDSLKPGRICKLVLYNGFQTEGRITERKNDTLIFETDITNLFIPVKDIKFVLNPDVDLSDLEENYKPENKIISEPVDRIDTTTECDVYFDNKSVLTDVKLIVDTDSTLKALRNDNSKIINIAGIRKIVFKTPAPFGNGYLYGSAVGFGIGFFSLAFASNSGEWHIGGIGPGLVFGFILSIPTGLIGGVIGVLAAADDVYLFDSGNTLVKIKRIRFTMEKHY